MKLIMFFLILSLDSSIVEANQDTSLCIAHRGNNISHIENTLSSFSSAYNIGSDGIELDIRHTKDGVGIIFHDSRPRRLLIGQQGKNCKKLKKIKNQNFEDLYNSCQYKNGEKILTLKKFLETSHQWDIWKFFELKDTPSNKTIDLFKTYLSDYSKVKFISFKSKALTRTLASLERNVKKDLNFLKLYYFWFPGKPKWTPNFPFHSYWIFSRRFLRLNKFYSLGLWVIDDIETINWAKDAGVRFITTNDPKSCLSR